MVSQCDVVTINCPLHEVGHAQEHPLGFMLFLSLQKRQCCIWFYHSFFGAAAVSWRGARTIVALGASQSASHLIAAGSQCTDCSKGFTGRPVRTGFVC